MTQDWFDIAYELRGELEAAKAEIEKLAAQVQDLENQLNEWRAKASLA